MLGIEGGDALNTAKAVAEIAVATKDGRVPIDSGFSWTAGAGWSIFLLMIVNLFRQAPQWWDRITGRIDKTATDKASRKLTDHERLAMLEERVTRMSTTLGGLMNAIIIGIDGLESDDSEERRKSADRMRMHVDLAISSLGKDDPFFDALTRMGREVAESAAETRPRGMGPAL